MKEVGMSLLSALRHKEGIDPPYQAGINHGELEVDGVVLRSWTTSPDSQVMQRDLGDELRVAFKKEHQIIEHERDVWKAKADSADRFEQEIVSLRTDMIELRTLISKLVERMG